jgi:hypothetical protein
MVRKSWRCLRIALVLLSVSLAAPATACSDPFSTDEGTHVRLRNSSTFDLTSVTFRPGQAELKFAHIEPGATTSYIPVANAYRYGYLELIVDGAPRVIQPIDYVGESFIGEGRFTYVITIDPSTLNPGITMVKDGS